MYLFFFKVLVHFIYQSYRLYIATISYPQILVPPPSVCHVKPLGINKIKNLDRFDRIISFIFYRHVLFNIKTNDQLSELRLIFPSVRIMVSLPQLFFVHVFLHSNPLHRYFSVELFLVRYVFSVPIARALSKARLLLLHNWYIVMVLQPCWDFFGLSVFLFS